jgi:hypothetical protein
MSNKQSQNSVYENCSSWLESPPRKVALWTKWKLRTAKPNWLTRRDDLWPNYINQLRYLQQGHVVWGALIQANTLLFKPGATDCPAEILFSTDPTKPDPGIKYLRQVASEVFDLKNTTPDDPRKRIIADQLTDELVRSDKAPIPSALSPNCNLSRCSILVHRRHLPGGLLALPYFPILVSEDLPFATILPSHYWHSKYTELWELNVKAAIQ